MGYDVHITRAALWTENEEQHIPGGEWLATIAEDTELTPDPSNGPYSARWSRSGSTDVGWFDWLDGNVYTTNPTREAIAKMLTLADSLSAAVQGDDGEVYDHEQEPRTGC